MIIRMRIPSYLRYIIAVYLLGMVCFTLFRIILYFSNTHHLSEAVNAGNLLEAFRIGLQYDTVISAYILAVPLLVTFTLKLRETQHSLWYQLTHIFVATLFLLSFFICCADIPYFRHNFCRLDITVFNWFDSPKQVVGMILAEPSYFTFLILFIGVCIGYTKLANVFYRRYLLNSTHGGSVQNKAVFLLCFIPLFFLAIRGRIDAPIRTDNATFCNNALLNQLGLNPVFTLSRSFLDQQKTSILEDEQALQQAVKYLEGQNEPEHPIARYIHNDSARFGYKPNVVLVLMESMSAYKMGRFGNQDRLTPFLDSLASVSWSFDRTYSAGIHTYNGVYSTLYGFPAIWRKHSMAGISTPSFSGLPAIMKQEKYNTVFFTTHDSYFDNLDNFLLNNYIDELVSERDYPGDELSGPFGVPDHLLFKHAIEKLDLLNKKPEPFFATLLTVSDHGPYHVPNGIPFKPKHEDIKQAVIEYADWSISSFITAAKSKSWFDSTVFVFVADHGGLVGENPYEMALSFNHIPFIIYHPSLGGKSFMQQGMQTDVFPTLCGVLGISYVNNTMGVDLLKQKRKYAYFSADNKVGVLSENRFLIYKESGKAFLFDHAVRSVQNIAEDEKELADDMKKYAFCFIQSSVKLIEEHKTGYISPEKFQRNPKMLAQKNF